MVLKSIIQLEVSPSCPYTPSRINPKRLNRHVTRTLKREGGITIKRFLDVVEHEATLSHLIRSEERNKSPSSLFLTESSIASAKQRNAIGKKDRTTQCLLSLRKQYCKLLRAQSEKPSTTRFQETQLLCLPCADVEERHNQEPCFDMHDLNAALPVVSATNIGVLFTPRVSKA
jgi:hypothetical protein